MQTAGVAEATEPSTNDRPAREMGEDLAERLIRQLSTNGVCTLKFTHPASLVFAEQMWLLWILLRTVVVIGHVRWLCSSVGRSFDAHPIRYAIYTSHCVEDINCDG